MIWARTRWQTTGWIKTICTMMKTWKHALRHVWRWAWKRMSATVKRRAARRRVQRRAARQRVTRTGAGRKAARKVAERRMVQIWAKRARMVWIWAKPKEGKKAENKIGTIGKATQILESISTISTSMMV